MISTLSSPLSNDHLTREGHFCHQACKILCARILLKVGLFIHHLQPDGTDLFNFIDRYQSWADYLTNMEQDGTWGDHVILYATANCYETYIRVISSQSNHPELTIRPDGDLVSTSPLVLGHVHEVHYVSLQPQQGEASRKHFVIR